MSDIRNRITAVLYEDGQRPMATAVRLTDAVLAELDLTKEFGCNTDARHGCRCSHRYTTNWKRNNID